MEKLLLSFIKAYRYLIRPYLGSCCRFEPSCSCYAEEAIKTLGPWRGSLKIILRLLRCHPLASGGWDPVSK